MPKHRAGGKFAGSHTTLIDSAEVVVDTAAKLPEVSKIVLCIIEKASSKNQRLKFHHIPAGLKIVVYGPAYLQNIFVYTSNPTKTEKEIAQAFHDR